MLYPLLFNKEFIEKSYGSDNLLRELLHGVVSDIKIGEAILLGESGEYQTRVSNGLLEGNQLSELIEIYMEDLVGDSVYEIFGEFFPLTIKLIDACQRTPIYIHPTSEVAYEREESFGKDLFIYILSADKDSQLYLGFKDVNIQIKDIEKDELYKMMNGIKISKGDAFYIPAGMPYSIGSKVKALEVHQNSTINYILSGDDSVDEIDEYKYPEEFAIEAIDNDLRDFSKINIKDTVFSNGLYTATLKSIKKSDLYKIEEREFFTAIFAVDGEFSFSFDNEQYKLKSNELIFIPARLSSVDVVGDGSIIEISLSSSLKSDIS